MQPLCCIDVCIYQVMQDIEELNRLCQLTTRPYVKKLLQHESEKLSHSCSTPANPVDSGPEPTDTDEESGCRNATAAVRETSTQHSEATMSDTAAVTNPCIAVTRCAPKRYYKEITTYGEMVRDLKKIAAI